MARRQAGYTPFSLAVLRRVAGTAHKLARIVYHLMRYGVAYMRQEEGAYAAEVRARTEKSLHKRARELGYRLVPLDPPPGAAPPATVEPAAAG